MPRTNLQIAHLLVDYSGPLQWALAAAHVLFVWSLLDSSRLFRLGGSICSLGCAILFAGLYFQLCGGYSATQSEAVAVSPALGETLALCILVWARTRTSLLQSLDVTGVYDFLFVICMCLGLSFSAGVCCLAALCTRRLSRQWSAVADRQRHLVSPSRRAQTWQDTNPNFLLEACHSCRCYRWVSETGSCPDDGRHSHLGGHFPSE